VRRPDDDIGLRVAPSVFSRAPRIGFIVHIAIDDTYGPAGPTRSKYVTGARRTHVAVIFEDDEVEEVRRQLRNCLDYMGELLPRAPKEFHFVDIYNGYGDWGPFKKDGRNLRLIEAFGNIYASYRWPVMVQTIDDRTFRDHEIAGFKGKLDGLDLSDRQDLSLFLLCVKIKMQLTDVAAPLTVIVDEGKKKSNTAFGRFLFRDRKQYDGRYATSSQEPLLQIADLLAFCINRLTHLSLKEKRTATDLQFMGLVNHMRIRSADLSQIVVWRDFTVEEIDRFHRFYRSRKGMRNP
jgi:hypothetical protein